MKRRVKTPTVIQMEAVECGAACLGIVLGYFGAFVPLEELRVKCGVTRDGSNALNLIKAARGFGLNATGFRASDIEDLKKHQMPLVVFWEFKHFLVVEGFGSDQVYINDPASGPRKISYKEFDESFTGIAIHFEKTENFQKSKKPKKLVTLAIERLKNVKVPLIFLALCGLGLLIPNLFVPVTSRVFFDNVLGHGLVNQTFAIVLILSFLALLTIGFTLFQNRYLNRLNIRLLSVFSFEFVWHLLHLPLQFYSQRYGGEIAYRVQLNEKVAKTLTGTLVPTFVNFCLIIFYATVMFNFDRIIALIGIGAALCNLFALVMINRSRLDAYARVQQESGKSIGFSIGALQNIESIKAAGNEDDFFSRWAGRIADKVNAEREINAKDVLLTSVPPFLQNLALIFLLGIGGLRILNGELTVGILMALQGLMSTFLLPVNQLVNLGSTLQTLKIDVDRLNDVLRYPEDVVYQSHKKRASDIDVTGKLEGFLELQNVTFGYNPNGDPLIENFSFSLKPGQRVAFVGPSGSGKSTLSRLVSGLYQPWSGQILFDGKPITEIPRSVFTRSVSMVDQKIVLFSGSIRDNLTLWDSTIAQATCVEAAVAACIHENIIGKKGGYEATVLEDGMNFSGGERQRLEIARALVNHPRYLIMDEATSTLDSLVELEISQNIRKMGCTCVMIAHRLSTIRECDEIIVLDKGKIVERGTHDELKKAKGLYYDLVEREQI